MLNKIKSFGLSINIFIIPLNICGLSIRSVTFFFVVIFLSGCEKDFDISPKDTEPVLVVEAYINNTKPDYNYVILSKSQTLANNDITSIPVKGAKVTITAGTRATGREIKWDRHSTTELQEIPITGLSANATGGIYTDPNLLADPSKALKGESGKFYLLEIDIDGKLYSATTVILDPIPIQLSTGRQFTDDDGIRKGLINVHFTDPDTLGNYMLFYWQNTKDKNSFGWGSMGSTKRITFSDEENNGNSIRLTNNQEFMKGDKITYYMAHVSKEVYQFWDSYNKTIDSDGLLSIPAPLNSNITGEHVTGCFSGLAISSSTIVMD